MSLDRFWNVEHRQTDIWTQMFCFGSSTTSGTNSVKFKITLNAPKWKISERLKTEILMENLNPFFAILNAWKLWLYIIHRSKAKANRKGPRIFYGHSSFACFILLVLLDEFCFISKRLFIICLMYIIHVWALKYFKCIGLFQISTEMWSATFKIQIIST